MMNYRERLFKEAEVRRKECEQWLKQFMRLGQPKPLTKNELYQLAKAELGISRSGFDQAWIGAIETTGRHDWYEPMRQRKGRPN